MLSQWLCGRVPLAFFVSRIRDVADRLGRKGRIFARFVKLLYYKKISVLLIYRWSNIFFFVKCFCEHVKMRPNAPCDFFGRFS